MNPRRPRLCLPTSLLTSPDRVHLIAGEDFRWTFEAPGADHWLPPLLTRCDGSRPMEQLIDDVPTEHRDAARELFARAYGERLMVDGGPESAHVPCARRLCVEGAGALADAIRATPPGTGPDLPLLCQDRLDYHEALEFNRRCRSGADTWLWATIGPMSRAFVGPLFLRDAGPCLHCLVRNFQRLSPVPDLYDALIEHAQRGGRLESAPFPAEGLGIVRALVAWKAAQAAADRPSPALYRLHVLEAATLEVSVHRVFVDPECPTCAHGLVGR
jgi:bacteriocin biosynthesis cyclodehydratase domain-containing protein